MERLHFATLYCCCSALYKDSFYFIFYILFTVGSCFLLVVWRSLNLCLCINHAEYAAFEHFISESRVHVSFPVSHFKCISQNNKPRRPCIPLYFIILNMLTKKVISAIRKKIQRSMEKGNVSCVTSKLFST